MIPFYILKVKKFDTVRNKYSTYEQLGFNGVKDNEPKTEFKKHNSQIIDGYIKYDLLCEKVVKQKGRAYGTDEIFAQFISINDSNFYYSMKSNIIILLAKKDIFNKFYKDFKKDKFYNFEKLDVNFEYIINNRLSLGIQSIWLGEIPDINVDALMFWGTHIENSIKYKQLKDEGAEITNISLIYNFNNEQVKIMITKDGGIILYNQRHETDSLLLLEDIYENLLNPNS